ncbi:MAG TPA: hypothetical protein VGD67_02295 [Pseudonocardiaceae bacterium]
MADANPQLAAALNADPVVACADLVVRAGARQFEIGYLRDGVPVDQAGWHASAYYGGARLTVEEHQSPSTAALALAERILAGATCKCRRPVRLADDASGCRWRLVGARWEPGCTADPIHVDGPRGDLGAMRRALTEGGGTDG